MDLDDIYAHDVRRHQLLGKFLEAAHTVALFLVLWVAGVVILGVLMWWLGGLFRV